MFLDEGRVVGSALLPLPEREASPLRSRLRAAMEGAHASGAADASVQAACLSMTASLLSDCPPASSTSNALALASSASLNAEADKEVRRVTDLFVRSQPILSRAFARKLSETAMFKRFMEVLIRDARNWPSWMHFFAVHARHEKEKRGR